MIVTRFARSRTRSKARSWPARSSRRVERSDSPSSFEREAATSPDLGTEEWQGTGLEDPFVGDFATYGTNPGTHASYRQRVATVASGSGVYDVRWYSSTQEFYGTAIARGDRFVTGAVLAADEGASNVSWFARGYGVAAYDLGSGQGVVVVRNTPEAPALLGQERLRRP